MAQRITGDHVVQEFSDKGLVKYWNEPQQAVYACRSVRRP